MHCSRCGAENPDRAKFCEECGSPLMRRCPSCDTENSPTAKFCIECAKPLESARGKSHGTAATNSPIQISVGTGDASLEGERKTVTALFADIKGSMELIEDLDPEEARAIVDPALKLMMEAVQHYGGYVAQSTGDGIFALFGAPVTHEDHPQRALYAALRMQEELNRYSDRIRAEGRLPIQARVGVNSGEVVVRSITTGEGRTEYVPVGHSTGIAARMQALAPVGSIAATEPVRKQCEGYFLFNSLGPTKVKGVSEPVKVYEVTGLGPLRTRLQRAAAHGYTEFAGREREMETMKQAAELAKTGHGQIVAAVAEPGVGKSRLFFEFKAKNQFGWMVLEAFSVSHGKATVYLPVIELLQGYFRITTDDDQRTRREKVNGRISTLDPAHEDTRPYLFGLLGLIEGADPLAQMDPQIRRRRTQDAIKRILLRESLNQPLMLVFEDLHQIDDETQAFLNLFADSMGSSQVLLLVNYRTEYSHSWGSKTFYTQIGLDPLGKEGADRMLTTLLGRDESVTTLKQLIADKTEGNPLFMEEIYQALIEEGVLVRNGVLKVTRPLNTLKIPATVQAILAARIDRLPSEHKDLLDTVAVIGKDFRLGLVGKVVARPQEELEEMLAQLQLAEFIYEQPSQGDVEYEFKHALTQEVAYNSSLIERRKAQHERTAAAIESLYRANLDDHVSELTNHYGRSANTRKAVEYLRRSGQQAMRRSAYQEGFAYLTRGLELLRQLPDDSQRQRQELSLQRALVELPLASDTSPEKRSAMERMLHLSERLGDRGQLFDALVRLSISFEYEDFSRAGGLAQRALTVAEDIGHPAWLAWAHVLVGDILQHQGELAASKKELEKGLALAESASQFISYGRRAWFLTFLAQALWLLGYPGQALDRAEQARALAKNEPDLWWRGACEHYAHDVRLLLHHEHTVDDATRLLTFATEHGIPYLIAQARISLGGALAQHGRPAEGVAEIELGMKEGVPMKMPWLSRDHAQLADAYTKIGRFSDGLQLVAGALRRTEETGEVYLRAEFYRLKGELLLASDNTNVDEAERAFGTAIEIARQQAARSLELRSTISLARLLRDTNRRDEAHTMLADLYGWFAEGFDTADLKDAKALLDELE